MTAQPEEPTPLAGALGWATPGVTGLGTPVEVLRAPARPALAALARAVDAVLALDPDHPAAEAELLALDALGTRLTAALLTRLGAVEASGSWAGQGQGTLRAWLAARTGSDLEPAGEQVRLARGLRTAPVVRAALAEGRVRVEHAVHVCRGLDRLAADLPDDPAQCADPSAWEPARQVLDAVEPALVTAAEHLGPRALGVEVRRRTAALVPLPAHRDVLDLAAARRFTMRKDLDGGWSGSFRLGPEDGQLVETARQAWRRTDHRTGDRRTPAQRDADALVGLVRTAVEQAGLPAQHGVRPHLLVLTPFATWAAAVGDPGTGASGASASGAPAAEASHPDPATTVDGEPVHAPALARLSCDARVTRLVLDPAGRPLDVGRTTRSVPPAVWLAAVARDRGCAVAGCTQPPERCEGHHVDPYALGGATSLANTRLLCTGSSGHHAEVHDHGQVVRLRTGEWIGPRGWTDPPDRPPPF